MPPLGAHGPGHAHLRPPGRRQHDEDEEDQQHPDHDGKQPHDDEDAGYARTGSVRRVEHPFLDVKHPELGQPGEQGAGLALHIGQPGVAQRVQRFFLDIFIGQRPDEFVGQSQLAESLGKRLQIG